MRNKQSAWCVFFVLILVVVVGVVGAIPNARASEQRRPTGTDVGGIISTNTVWNLAGSPYNLTDRVQIAVGITLTIESGVIVNGDGNQLETFGTLSVIGNAQSRVVFNDVIITAGSNSTMDPPGLIDINFAEINRGSVHPFISGTGTLLLRDSLLLGTLSDIYLWFPTLEIYIERNVFYRSAGINSFVYTEPNPGKIYIRNNLFLEQKISSDGGFAIQASGGGASKIIVEFNSFLSNDRRALYIPPGYTSAGMTAANNYWGGASNTVIDSMIFDRNDDLNSASVINYLPVLSSPHPDTPLFDPPIPTPTPTSTESPTPSSTPTQTPVPEGIYAPRAYLPSAFRQVPLPTMTPTSTSTPMGIRADDFEPNDSSSEVLNRPGGAVSYINVGSQIAGVNFFPYGGRTPITMTGVAGDVDWYFFYGKKFLALGGTGGCYQIKTAIQPGVDTDISIYSDPPVNLLAHNDDVAPLNRSSQINLALPDDGTYWIKVLNLDSTPRGVGQTYNLSIAEYLPIGSGCAASPTINTATSTSLPPPPDTPTPTPVLGNATSTPLPPDIIIIITTP